MIWIYKQLVLYFYQMLFVLKYTIYDDETKDKIGQTVGIW